MPPERTRVTPVDRAATALSQMASTSEGSEVFARPGNPLLGSLHPENAFRSPLSGEHRAKVAWNAQTLASVPCEELLVPDSGADPKDPIRTVRFRLTNRPGGHHADVALYPSVRVPGRICAVRVFAETGVDSTEPVLLQSIDSLAGRKAWHTDSAMPWFILSVFYADWTSNRGFPLKLLPDGASILHEVDYMPTRPSTKLESSATFALMYTSLKEAASLSGGGSFFGGGSGLPREITSQFFVSDSFTRNTSGTAAEVSPASMRADWAGAIVLVLWNSSNECCNVGSHKWTLEVEMGENKVITLLDGIGQHEIADHQSMSAIPCPMPEGGWLSWCTGFKAPGARCIRPLPGVEIGPDAAKSIRVRLGGCTECDIKQMCLLGHRRLSVEIVGAQIDSRSDS